MGDRDLAQQHRWREVWMEKMGWLKTWKMRLRCGSVQQEGGDRAVSIMLLKVEGVELESRARI